LVASSNGKPAGEQNVKKKLLSDEELAKVVGKLFVHQLRSLPDDAVSDDAVSVVDFMLHIWAEDPDSYFSVMDSIHSLYPSKRKKARLLREHRRQVRRMRYRSKKALLREGSKPEGPRPEIPQPGSLVLGAREPGPAMPDAPYFRP
jgi:hypothetical protein